MTAREIEDDHTLAKHCTLRVFADPETRTELTPSAFEPTEDNPEISVNWLEFHAGDIDDRLHLVREDLARNRSVKPIHRLALIGVRELKAIGKHRDCELGAVHDPRPNNPSHSLIVGISLHDRILHQELADAASRRIVDAIG